MQPPRRSVKKCIGVDISEVSIISQRFVASAKTQIVLNHPLDCMNPMRSDDWAPAWVAENRHPSFLDFGGGTVGQEFEQMIHGQFSQGIALYASRHFTTSIIKALTDVLRRWGNMPATDVINLARNEKNSTRDFSLAYVGVYPVNIFPLQCR